MIFYDRNLKRRLSQMPFIGDPADQLPADILGVEQIGDYKRFVLKVSAKDEEHAKRILMGMIGKLYYPLEITDCPRSLFDGDLFGGDFISPPLVSDKTFNHLYDFTCNVSHSGVYYQVIARGIYVGRFS